MKTWNVNNLIFVLAIAYTTQGSSMEKPITKEFRLDNGLKIVVREDHRAPVAVSQIWYKVGSADEHRGITGISHALEHMMFQGTPDLPGESFSKLISQNGGRDNAFTGDDFTAYYEEMDAQRLDISMKVEADRMQHLTLSADAFAKEIQVVIEERRLRTDDNPQQVAIERFMAAANVMGPYHHPTIGWQSDLDHMTVEDLRHWYNRWYAPNNATLVVVGDVNADQIRDMAEKHFGHVPVREISQLKSQSDLKPVGETRLKVEIPAKLPYLLMGYDVPSIKSAEYDHEPYAIMLASALLDGGDSARFARNLIRGTQLASSASASYDPFKEYRTQFILSGVPSEGHQTAELEAKFLEEIERLKNEPVTPQELQRVKNQLLAQEVFERDSMADQAILLGLLETVGLNWRLADELTDKIKAVTVEQIQEVAKKYFINKSLTVANLIPQPMTAEEQAKLVEQGQVTHLEK